MDYLGRKLLIIGATAETAGLVAAAEKMGIATYVADNNPDAPAKRHSTHPTDIDCFDIDALEALVNDNRIDGIALGCADILVPVYEELCRRTGKFCYLNRRIVEALGNKKGLKEALGRAGLPTIPEFSYDEVIAAGEGFAEYPLFVKPVDNNSSKGTSRVLDFNGFESAYRKALSCSRSGEVLIEKDLFHEHDFALSYIIQDGNAVLALTADRYARRYGQVGAQLANALLVPSVRTATFVSTTQRKVEAMLRDLGFSNGVFACQAFEVNGEFMLYDPAARLTGGQEHILLSKFYGIDVFKMLIDFALTGSMGQQDALQACRLSELKFCSCVLLISAQVGTIGGIEGVEDIRNLPSVQNVTQKYYPGDTVTGEGTLGQNVLKIHLVAKDSAHIAEAIGTILGMVSIKDTLGNEMALEHIDYTEVM